jgi:hypothetical protein
MKHATKLQKSVPLFYEISPLPNSAVVKMLLREIIASQPEPLTLEEAKQLKKNKLNRKRVYLSMQKDQDLIEFFFRAPITTQYSVFKRLNEKLLNINKNC